MSNRFLSCAKLYKQIEEYDKRIGEINTEIQQLNLQDTQSAYTAQINNLKRLLENTSYAGDTFRYEVSAAAVASGGSVATAGSIATAYVLHINAINVANKAVPIYKYTVILGMRGLLFSPGAGWGLLAASVGAAIALAGLYTFISLATDASHKQAIDLFRTEKALAELLAKDAALKAELNAKTYHKTLVQNQLIGAGCYDPAIDCTGPPKQTISMGSLIFGTDFLNSVEGLGLSYGYLDQNTLEQDKQISTWESEIEKITTEIQKLNDKKDKTSDDEQDIRRFGQMIANRQADIKKKKHSNALAINAKISDLISYIQNNTQQYVTFDNKDVNIDVVANLSPKSIALYGKSNLAVKIKSDIPMVWGQGTIHVGPLNMSEIENKFKSKSTLNNVCDTNITNNNRNTIEGYTYPLSASGTCFYIVDLVKVINDIPEKIFDILKGINGWSFTNPDISYADAVFNAKKIKQGSTPVSIVGCKGK